MTKFYIGGVVIALVFFFIGMQVGKSTQGNTLGGQNGRSFGNGQMMGGQNGGRTSGMMRGGGIVSGTIVSFDDKSVTISLRDGGTKTIYISGTTIVSKSAVGTRTDLLNGSNIIVNGTANQDGSIAATSVQLRPIDQIPATLKK